MAPTVRRQTLTVQELHDLTDKAAAALCNRAETIEVREALAADLLLVTRLASDIIGASHMGCAADDIILTLGGETQEYDVWYRHAHGDPRERLIVVDATTPHEAKVLAERHFAGGLDVEILRAYSKGQLALMEKVAGELRKRGLEARVEYPGYIEFPGADSGGRQTRYAFGTANATWGGNRVAEDGEIVGATLEFPEFRSDDLTLAPAVIAERIATAVRS